LAVSGYQIARQVFPFAIKWLAIRWSGRIERIETMNSKRTISVYQATRQLLALMLSLLLVPAAQLDLYAQAPAPQQAYVALSPVQLDQLVAPIALDPDSLVAQVLTASTYPDQVAAADAWLNQNMGLPPDQRAAAANAMPWDPAVKGLTEFPQVLDNLARNTAWASQLGNAYYNQPGDVMNAVQAMRFQAQQSHALATTPQQRVYEDNGAIAIAPVNPAVVYVPYYNPWSVWGGLFAPYPGFYVLPPPPGLVLGLGIGFGIGIGIGVFAGFGWGFRAWGAGWGGGGVLFGGRTYISNSVTVINHGNFGGHETGAFERGGPGVPGGFRAAAHVGAARAAAFRGGVGAGAGAGRPAFAPGGRSAFAGSSRPAPAGAGRPGSAPAARPGFAGSSRPGSTPAARPGSAPAARPGPAPAARPGPAPAARPGPAPAARPGPASGGHSAPPAHSAPAEGGHKK
jgi:Protein of unknown function (DUF3300)